jgi:hypothetical protein
MYAGDRELRQSTGVGYSGEPSERQLFGNGSLPRSAGMVKVFRRLTAFENLHHHGCLAVPGDISEADIQTNPVAYVSLRGNQSVSGPISESYQT